MTPIRTTHCVVLVSLAAVVLSGCASPAQRAAIWTRMPHSGELNEAELNWLENLCGQAFGAPEKSVDWVHGPTHLVAREGYALEHSSLDKVPLWVCEHVLPEHLNGSTTRRSWRADPKLPAGERAVDADYTGSGYDRGHNAPRADFQYSQARVDDTFYLSNAAPQVGPKFNQSVWRVLEERARDCVRAHGEAHIITGVFFYDPDEDNAATADGIIDYFVIGSNEVAVPTHFYKIIVVPTAAGGRKATAIVMANQEYPSQPDADYDFATFIWSIDDLEARTGLNFLPRMDADEPELAATLESQPGEIWDCLAPGS